VTPPDVAAFLKAPLAELGFKKRAGEIFTMEVTKEVLGWLGLNRASEHLPSGQVEINPVVGVRHQGIERMVAELRGEKFHPYLPPTLSLSLGHLFPEPRHRAWTFGASSGDAIAAELAGAVAAHGLPFIQARRELPAICLGLEQRLGFDYLLRYRRPVAYLLAGDPEGARRILEESLAPLAHLGDAGTLDFRRFGEALLARL
jgi:hypothetical protein